MALGSFLSKQIVLISTALFLLYSAAAYLFSAYTTSDLSGCTVLLKDGSWLDPAQRTHWQPPSCMLHSYRSAHIKTCFEDKRVVFIGGDTTLQLFKSLARRADPLFQFPSSPHPSQLLRIDHLRLEFVWDPVWESSALRDVVTGFKDAQSIPALTVVGVEATNPESEPSNAASIISDLRRSTPLHKRQSDSVIFLPAIELPYNSSSEIEHDFNKTSYRLPDLTSTYGVNTANVFTDIVADSAAWTSNGEPTARTVQLLLDIILNHRCNKELPKHYPFAQTCCNSYPRLSWVQFTGLALVSVLLVLAATSHIGTRLYASSSVTQYLPNTNVQVSALTVGAALVLCYICDRTNTFGKESKLTSPSQFFVIMGLIIFASFFTLQTKEKDQAFLNRDQTDEWKGWMQVAILVYHYVGVSKTEYIYNYMRVMPTAYLFMTGFGHTVYFLKKQDFSLRRYVATMLRLNLLNVLLAYTMGNDWLLYYFAPLVTWNFHVAYILLWVNHKNNSNTKFLLGKILVAALLNAAICRVPGVLEHIWSVLQLVFRMQGDLREWRFRVSLDQYSMFPGMIAAILFVNWSNYEFPSSKQWPTFYKSAIGVSAAIMLGYAGFEASQPSKQVYNTKHTYVSWLPCCAFVVLRNATPRLRRTHNGLFAWFGRGSLETFLLQFHLWLAADTAGLLMLGPPKQRLLNALITTPIFLSISSAVTSATPDLVEWLLGPAKRPAAATKSADVEMAPLAAEEAGAFGKLRAALDDLRVRLAVMLSLMAFLNWTYYIGV